MADEVRGAITSDKVETDNTNFATVKADQTCEEALIPRENAFRQLEWQVTLEKGSVYDPQENVGIYAGEIDCKYGVQVDGDLFGRDAVQFEAGGAAHGDDTIGARVFGSVISEGTVDVLEASSKLDDWEEAPVSVYGDVVGGHVTFDEPTVVYGSVSAEQTLRVNAPTVVVGDVHSEGIVEATDLFAFSIVARDDVTLGGNVAVVNPVVTSAEGEIRVVEPVGLMVPAVFEHVSQGNDVDAVGPWIFDVEAVWENRLLPEDVTDVGEGQVCSRSWRTVDEPGEAFYERAREQFRSMVDATRKDPPDLEEFRYAGVASLSELGGETTIEGDVVVGSQEKTVEETEVTEIDQSTTVVDESTEVHDHSTTVEDSVVNRSDVGADVDVDEGEDGDSGDSVDANATDDDDADESADASADESAEE